MGKIRDKIERFLEDIEDARIANRRYVSNYVTSLIYKDLKKPLVYGIIMRDTTVINGEELKNEYAQNITIDFSSKDYENNYWFGCGIKSENFKLDKALVGQETLVKQLNSLTENIRIGIAQSGFIRKANHEKVVEKWGTLKEKLLINYTSQQAIGYIQNIDRKIHNYNLYLEDLKQPHFLGLLFGGYQQLGEQSAPRTIRISNLIGSFSIFFNEKISTITKDQGKRTITFNATMHPFHKDTTDRLKEYFTMFDMSNASLHLSKYNKEVVLDLTTGYVTEVYFEIEVSNGGYTQNRTYTLKQHNNG